MAANALEFWRLSEALSIFQAAMLITGHDPETYTSENVRNWDRIPAGYGAALNALSVAVRNGSLKAKIVGEIGFDPFDDPVGEIPGTINVDATYIDVPSLIEYLRKRNFGTAAFGTVATSEPEYLDPFSGFYAPKLAAAVDAWLAVTSQTTEASGGTPKRRIDKWLRENAVIYGLTKADGSANEEAIQQISKIANWRPEGGAAKTPVRNEVGSTAPTNPSTPLKKVGKKKPPDDIPF